MKKKILGGFAVVVIAAVAAFNINIDMSTDSNLSTVNLANVEALAQDEGGTVTCSNSCGGEFCGTFTNPQGNSWPVYYC